MTSKRKKNFSPYRDTMLKINPEIKPHSKEDDHKNISLTTLLVKIDQVIAREMVRAKVLASEGYTADYPESQGAQEVQNENPPADSPVELMEQEDVHVQEEQEHAMSSNSTSYSTEHRSLDEKEQSMPQDPASEPVEQAAHECVEQLMLDDDDSTNGSIGQLNHNCYEKSGPSEQVHDSPTDYRPHSVEDQEVIDLTDQEQIDPMFEVDCGEMKSERQEESPRKTVDLQDIETVCSETDEQEDVLSRREAELELKSSRLRIKFETVENLVRPKNANDLAPLRLGLARESAPQPDAFKLEMIEAAILEDVRIFLRDNINKLLPTLTA